MSLYKHIPFLLSFNTAIPSYNLNVEDQEDSDFHLIIPNINVMYSEFLCVNFQKWILRTTDHF